MSLDQFLKKAQCDFSRLDNALTRLDPNPNMQATSKLEAALGARVAQSAVAVLNDIADGKVNFNDGRTMPQPLKKLIGNALGIDPSDVNFTVEASTRLMSDRPYRVGPVFDAEEARALIKILQGNGGVSLAACEKK